ncbi:hypothetical protein niasHS_004575 [Heterodera schachtii]|uniref:EF-hand domain-containing protein n=1 Tax=Heterodera schachtii TaxID=97005 RepID=A0ABD2JQV1_HETSC
MLLPSCYSHYSNVGSPWCNVFGGNCVVCEFVFIPTAGCQLITKCSCYYCCEEQYKDYCPQGCENCVTDGEGGCHENAKSREKFEGCASTGSTSNIRGGGETAFSKLKRKTEAQMAFEMIDTDLDGFISKEEGIHYLRTSQHQSSTPADLDKNSSWFDTMDQNGNKKIDPEEFDRLLGTK